MTTRYSTFLLSYLFFPKLSSQLFFISIDTCSDSSECENGGFCERVEEYAQFCRCPDGTKGDFCEVVPGCTTKDCGDHAKCVYDVKKQIAVCVCEDERYAFDPDLYKCRSKFHSMKF